MIGSQTKALRFRKRLADAGFAAQSIEKIHSPIGLPEVKGKLPMEVAVSIAAQLQSLYYQRVPVQSGLSTSWRDIKTIMQVQKTTGILCE
jgi:xanthine dehydrogenase accessory factor